LCIQESCGYEIADYAYALKSWDEGINALEWNIQKRGRDTECDEKGKDESERQPTLPLCRRQVCQKKRLLVSRQRHEGKPSITFQGRWYATVILAC
jgi:hypothetical protein